MKSLYPVLVALVLAFGSQSANAQIATSVEIFALGVDLNKGMVTPDYFAQQGKLSMFGFVELVGDGSWFTNHTATYALSKYVGLYGEASVNDAHQVSTSIGPAFNVPMPGFVYFKARPTAVVGDLARTRELNLVWKTKPLRIGGGEVWSEGFIRTLRDEGNTYGQPQLLYRRAGSSWHYGIEVEVSGASRTLRGGLRYTH